MRLLRRNLTTDATAAGGYETPTELSSVLLDLGVSSPQLDRGDRGFSYRNSGPLDMRMDPTSGRPASDVVNDADHGELVRILRRFGDERHADRIARAIIEARPVTTTEQLAEDRTSTRLKSRH